MPRILRKSLFSEQLLPLVQDFDCGDEPWEREVADWIKAPLGAHGALDEMDAGLRSCRVWLYAEQPNEVVGFGSLGPSRWPSPIGPINLIPNVGMRRQYHGQPGPPAPIEERFSMQIMRDLIDEAHKLGQSPLLALYVHPQNAKAIRLYTRLGFRNYSKTWTDPQSGVVYQGMILDRLTPRDP